MPCINSSSLGPRACPIIKAPFSCGPIPSCRGLIRPVALAMVVSTTQRSAALSHSNPLTSRVCTPPLPPPTPAGFKVGPGLVSLKKPALAAAQAASSIKRLQQQVWAAGGHRGEARHVSAALAPRSLQAAEDVVDAMAALFAAAQGAHKANLDAKREAEAELHQAGAELRKADADQRCDASRDTLRRVKAAYCAALRARDHILVVARRSAADLRTSSGSTGRQEEEAADGKRPLPQTPAPRDAATTAVLADTIAAAEAARAGALGDWDFLATVHIHNPLFQRVRDAVALRLACGVGADATAPCLPALRERLASGEYTGAAQATLHQWIAVFEITLSELTWWGKGGAVGEGGGLHWRIL